MKVRKDIVKKLCIIGAGFSIILITNISCMLRCTSDKSKYRHSINTKDVDCNANMENNFCETLSE